MGAVGGAVSKNFRILESFCLMYTRSIIGYVRTAWDALCLLAILQIFALVKFGNLGIVRQIMEKQFLLDFLAILLELLHRKVKLKFRNWLPEAS